MVRYMTKMIKGIGMLWVVSMVSLVLGQSLAQADPSEASMSKINRYRFDMIAYAPKAPKAVVTVFTDLDCGYCRKLHAEIPRLLELGIELRYLAYPRHGVGSASYRKMESVWCSKNRQSAMSKAMHGEAIPNTHCAHSLAAQFALAQQLGISGTPTLIFEDGTVWGGYLSAEKLAKEAIKHSQ